MPHDAYALENIDGAIAIRYVSQLPVFLGDAGINGGTLGSCKIFNSSITTGTPPAGDLVTEIVPGAGALTPLPVFLKGTSLDKGLVIQTLAATKFAVQWRPSP